MSANFNRRAFVTLVVFVFFCVVFISSLLMYFQAHTPLVATVHTGIGVLLLAALGWHITQNIASLKHYSRWRLKKPQSLPNWALPWALLTSLSFIALAIMQTAPFANLYAWGNRLREGQGADQAMQLTYTRLDKSPAGAAGNSLVIDLRKGPYFHWPQYAIWLETLDGQFIQPLFVTEKLARNKFSNLASPLHAGQVFNSDISGSDDKTWDQLFSFVYSPDTAQQRARPESLPVFLHQQASTQPREIYHAANAPAEPSPQADAYAGATILDNFLLQSRSQSALPEQFKIRFEINQAFDFNTYYSSDRFPDDPIYSGSGYSGQPSVIYEAIIDTRAKQQYYPMTLIGHGHHSGGDGEVHGDTSQLTTAKQLIDRIIVEVGT